MQAAAGLRKSFALAMTLIDLGRISAELGVSPPRDYLDFQKGRVKSHIDTVIAILKIHFRIEQMEEVLEG